MATPVEIILRAKDYASEQVRKLTSHVRQLGRRSTNASDGARTLGRVLDDLGPKADSFSGGIKRAAASLVAFVAAGAGLNQIRQWLVQLFDVGGKFEKFNKILATLQGGAEQGEAAFEWIKDFTESVPFELEGVTDAFIKLRAFGLDPMDGTLQAIADQAALLGGSQEKLRGITIALGQAWAKQKLQGEEVLQLVERGVPVWELLTETTGKTTAELFKMMEAGELGRDVIRELIDAIGRTADGAAQDQMSAWVGLVSNARDVWKRFLDEIANSGVLDYFKSQLKGILDQTKEMAADGRLQEYAQKISDTIVSAASSVKSFTLTVVGLADELKQLAKAFIAMKIGAFIQGFLAAATAVGAATRAVKAFTLALARTGVGAFVIALGYLAAEFFNVGDAADETREKMREQQEQADKLAKKYAEISTQTGLVIQSEQDLADAIEAGNLKLDARTGQYERITKNYEDITARTGVQVESELDLINAVESGTLKFNERTQQYELSDAWMGKLIEKDRQYQSVVKGTTVEIDAQARKLVESAEKGEEFRETLATLGFGTDEFAKKLSKLSEQEFAEFSAGAQEALGSKLYTEVEKASLQVDLFAESLRRAKLDPEEYRTGFTSVANAAFAAYQNIAESADATSEIIKDSFSNAIAAAGNAADIKRLKAELEQLGVAGRLSGTQVTNALEDIENKAQQVDEKLVKAHETLQTLGQGINSAETVSSLNDIGIAAAQAWQDGKISAEEYLEVMAQVDAQKEKLIETTKRLTEAEQEGADAAKGKGDEEEESSNKVIVARQAATEASKMEAEAMAKAREEINKTSLARGYGIQGLKDYWNAVEDLRDRYVEANKSAQQMADSVAQLDANTNVSTSTLEGYARGLEAAIRGGDELNSQSLSKLQSALSSVRSKIQAITSETQSAKSELAGLQGELAGLEGNQQRVQEIQYQQRRLDLINKINEAEETGNADAVKNYKASLDVLNRINRLKLQNIRADERESRQQNQQQSASQAPSVVSTTADRTVRMVFEADDGSTAEVYANDVDADSVVNIMQKAKGVSAK